MSTPVPSYRFKLPSKGLLYEGKLPNGEVEVRAMLTGDESVLYSPGEDSISKINIVISACLLTKDVAPQDLLMIDRFAILLGIRTHTFGTEYPFAHRCQFCNTQFKHKCNIGTDLKVNFMGEDADGNEFPISEPFFVQLPVSNVKLGYRLLRGRDEINIARYTKRVRMQSSDPTDPSFKFRLATQIVSLDDKAVQMGEATRFVNEMTAKDSRAFQLDEDKVERGVDTTLMIDCRNCGGTNEVDMPFSLEFFRPSSI